jgi:hypothetical protein
MSDRHYPRRSKPNTFEFTSKSILAFVALCGIVGSAIYWWRVQSVLTDDKIVAIVFTIILALAPPALISFVIPWTPASMLLQKHNAQTWGFPVVVGCSLYLLYYSFQLQWSWWAAQEATRESGLIYQQVFIGMIGFIIIPALLWTPVSSEELEQQVKQAQLVKRFELQTQADIAILRATLLRAQEKALIGFANLTVDEREELAAVMRSLVGGIDRTLREVGQTVKTVSGVTLPFNELDDNNDIQDVLEYISESLTGSTLRPTGELNDDAPAIVAPQGQLMALVRTASGEHEAGVLEHREDGNYLIDTPTGQRLMPESRIVKTYYK